MQKATAETVRGNLGASFRDGKTTWTFARSGDALRVRSAGAESGDYEVAYTLGVEPLQQLLIPLPDGRLQPLHVAWDARPKAAGGEHWFSLLGSEKVAPGDPEHWKSPAQSANATCVECHTTGFRKGFDVAANRYDSNWWRRASAARRARCGIAARRVGARGLARHRPRARRRVREVDGGAPERRRSKRARRVTRSARGSPRSRAAETRSSRLYTRAADRSLYHDDGQLAGEAYEWGSFVQSSEVRAGRRCSDCHEAAQRAAAGAGERVVRELSRARALRQRPRITITRRARRRRVSTATCPSTSSSTSPRSATTDSTCRGPISRSRSARPTRAAPATPSAVMRGRRRRSRAGAEPRRRSRISRRGCTRARPVAAPPVRSSQRWSAMVRHPRSRERPRYSSWVACRSAS
jgi:hypothetical protein